MLIPTMCFSKYNNDSIVYHVSNKIDSLPDGFHISIALIKNDSIDYIGFKKEDSVTQVNLEDSLFEIASVTKVFTSTLLAKKVIEKKIKLNSNVNKAFPYKFNNKIKLNYLALSNHTAGLYRIPSNLLVLMLKTPDTPYASYNFQKLDEYLKDELTLESEELKYSYSNLGPGILAYTLAKVENETFGTLLKKDIFSKYGMNATSFKASTSIPGINDNGEETENWEFNALSGAGGLVSNARDMSRFLQAHFNSEDEILSLTRKSTFTISENMAIGLGWHILDYNSEEPVYWHNGGSGGYRSTVGFKISNKTGVVVLSNISAFSKYSALIDELCFELLDSLK